MLGDIPFEFIGLPLEVHETCFDKSCVNMQIPTGLTIQVDDRTDCLVGTNATLKILLKNHLERPWNKYKGGEPNLYIASGWEDVIDIIRSVGTYNRKAPSIIEIARILDEECNGVVPSDREILESMPGVGRKVANVILSEWFKIPSIAVDTHVGRVSKRLGLASNDDSVLFEEYNGSGEITKWITFIINYLPYF
jgi:hypothetical protein